MSSVYLFLYCKIKFKPLIQLIKLMNNDKIKNLSKLVYTILYLSLILGFYLNEDLAGGAIRDFNFYIPVLNSFEEDFLFNFLNYKDFGLDHSPFFLSFINFINIPFYNVEFIFNKSR